MAVRPFILLVYVGVTLVASSSLPGLRMPRQSISAAAELARLSHFNRKSETEFKSVYSWINNTPLSDPLQWNILGLIQVNVINCTFLAPSQRLSNVNIQLSLFRGPLYLAYSWENEVGGNHSNLARLLKIESSQLNLTSDVLSYLVQSKALFAPLVAEEVLNNATRDFLTRHLSVISWPMTDEKVKGYRNYLIVNTLSRLFSYLLSCLPSQ